MTSKFNILLRGGGDLASGVALRLRRVGINVLITELPQPLVVRRFASYAEAVFSGEITVENVKGVRIDKIADAWDVFKAGEIPVLVDPYIEVLQEMQPAVIIDGRMTKRPPDLGMAAASMVIGLGPGFIAGENCHAVIETRRGHNLGRVTWNGAVEANTGIPENVGPYGMERVLRAPGAGHIQPLAEIGDHLEAGQPVLVVNGMTVYAPFAGVLRGLLHPSVAVSPGMKIGDVDPRDDPSFCRLISDKSLAIGGGVLEAILSREDIRRRLWDFDA